MKIYKQLKTFGFALTLLCASAGAALADPVLYKGTSSGGFSQNGSSLSSSVFGLAFNGGNFQSTSNSLTLGSFSYDAPLISLGGVADFILNLTFTTPGTGLGSFTADVSAKATFFTPGTASIEFNPDKKRINYSNTLGSGSFDLFLDTITLNDSIFTGTASANLIGKVSNAVFTSVPEPSALPEFSMYLAGIGVAMIWLRRKSLQASENAL